MITNHAIGEEIHAIHIQPFFLGTSDGEKAFNRGGGILDSGRIANHRERRFDDTALAVGHLQNGFACDLFDGRLKGTRQRPVDDGDSDNDPYSEGYAQESK
jgi:hypothetical protein